MEEFVCSRTSSSSQREESASSGSNPVHVFASCPNDTKNRRIGIDFTHGSMENSVSWTRRPSDHAAATRAHEPHEVPSGLGEGTKEWRSPDSLDADPTSTISERLYDRPASHVLENQQSTLPAILPPERLRSQMSSDKSLVAKLELPPTLLRR
jgi:hypothetical protein